tara:strand:+ start:364 stop:939 length:576 start_codon:yes stop_codon:yes gene_type:complete
MVGRVLLGKRGSDYGLFVSQKDVEVTNTSLTTPLAFDSRAVRGLIVHAKGENTIAAPSGGDDFATTSVNISHGLGYTPLVAVRWCQSSDISGGIATKMWTPHTWQQELEESNQAEGEEDEDIWKEYESKGLNCSVNSSNLTITNFWSGVTIRVEEDPGGSAPAEITCDGAETLYYAYIIFKAKDFTGGIGI